MARVEHVEEKSKTLGWNGTPGTMRMAVSPLAADKE